MSNQHQSLYFPSNIQDYNKTAKLQYFQNAAHQPYLLKRAYPAPMLKQQQMSVDFLLEFFSISIPLPHIRYIAGRDAKSDLKLVLEMATNSRLKQGQDKKVETKQVYYCRSLGKQCFKIQVEFTNDGYFQILDDYQQMGHRNCCQKTGEHPSVIRVYNLMMLKRELIEKFMEKQGLNNASPQTILQKLSGGNGEYFYCGLVSDIESKRKLKKRFDNIVNITIKKSKQIKTVQSKEEIENEKQVKTKRISKNQKPAKNSKAKASPKSKEYNPNWDSDKNDDYFSTQSKKQRIRRTPKVQSSSSFGYPKDANSGEIDQFEYRAKEDSIFEEEEEDYFKKNSEKNIAINLFNEVGSQNYWPSSENSIAQTLNPSDKLKRDDLFALMRNSNFKSVQRKSQLDIENHMDGGLHGSFERLT